MLKYFIISNIYYIRWITAILHDMKKLMSLKRKAKQVFHKCTFTRLIINENSWLVLLIHVLLECAIHRHLISEMLKRNAFEDGVRKTSS